MPAAATPPLTLARLKRLVTRVLRRPPAPRGDRPAGAEDGPAVPFRCNICGTDNAVAASQLSRETPSCRGCGSNVRFRAMVHLVVSELLGAPAALPDLPARKDLAGIGLSDAGLYAKPLADAFDYTNTYYHAEPRLDIANAPESMTGRYDFLIASDVFEHVVPPVAKAFAHARRILKPGGVFVFSVPFTLDPDTVEHYPELHDFRIVEERGAWTLHNVTADGRAQTFTDLVFHGGPGSTLEMRLFSRAALERAFAEAGFREFRIANEPYPPFGIVWPEPWSVPIVARA